MNADVLCRRGFLLLHKQIGKAQVQVKPASAPPPVPAPRVKTMREIMAEEEEAMKEQARYFSAGDPLDPPRMFALGELLFLCVDRLLFFLTPGMLKWECSSPLWKWNQCLDRGVPR